MEMEFFIKNNYELRSNHISIPETHIKHFADVNVIYAHVSLLLRGGTVKLFLTIKN